MKTCSHRSSEDLPVGSRCSGCSRTFTDRRIVRHHEEAGTLTNHSGVLGVLSSLDMWRTSGCSGCSTTQDVREHRERSVGASRDGEGRDSLGTQASHFKWLSDRTTTTTHTHSSLLPHNSHTTPSTLSRHGNGGVDIPSTTPQPYEVDPFPCQVTPCVARLDGHYREEGTLRLIQRLWCHHEPVSRDTMA